MRGFTDNTSPAEDGFLLQLMRRIHKKKLGQKLGYCIDVVRQCDPTVQAVNGI
jgi:hypothetical protein